MKKHILIEKAFRYEEPKTVPSPKGYSFQKAKGYWTKDNTGEILMLNDDYKLPATKKCDRETGEDQKGE